MHDPAVEADNSMAAFLKPRIKAWAEGAVAEHGAMFLDLMEVEIAEWRRKLRGPEITSYTVAERIHGLETGKQVLVTSDEIRTILNQMLRVGQIDSRQGDGSRPYAVFNKRDCAIKIAEMVNARYNSRRAES